MILNCPRCKQGKVSYKLIRPPLEEILPWEPARYLPEREPDTYTRNCQRCDWKEDISKETFLLGAQEIMEIRRKEKERRGQVRFKDLRLNQHFWIKRFPEWGVFRKFSNEVRIHRDKVNPHQPWFATHPDEEVIPFSSETNRMSMDNNNQPMPTKTDEVTTYELVHKDLDARKELGIKKYGVALQPNNGRDSLWDAYEESLDHTVYLRNEIAKRESQPPDTRDELLKEQNNVITKQAAVIVKAADEVNAAKRELERLKTENQSLGRALQESNSTCIRLGKDNERLSSQLVEVNNALSKLRGEVDNLNQINANENRRIVELMAMKRFPAEVWNVVTQAFYYGWNHRTEHHPADKQVVVKMCRAKMREIFKQLELPDPLD